VEVTNASATKSSVSWANTLADRRAFGRPDGWQAMDADYVLSVVFRQPFTKTFESREKTVKVQPDTLAMLRRRKLAVAPGQIFVIPSQSGKVLSADQMSMVWRRIVKGTELEWSPPRPLRSTRATAWPRRTESTPPASSWATRRIRL
jgi:hypothetical protein